MSTRPRSTETEHRVVPVYLDTDGVDEVDVPYGLRPKHSIKFSRVGGLDGVASKLLDLLDKVKLLAQPKVEFDALSDRSLGMLFVLQQVSQGLPASVLHEAVRDEGCRFAGELAGYIIAADADGEMNYALTVPLPSASKPRDAEELLARTLQELIGYIGQHKKDGIGARNIDAALALARRCEEASPRAARKLFDAVDGILKRLGDKNKVIEAANLSIKASKHRLRDDEDVQIEARALICGRSWVLQRVGHLDEALVEAKKSLELGEKIRWERNTAFCKKCLGRLYRMLGANEADDAEKKELFRKSIECLKEAVNIFRRMDKFGADCPEVGDCYSLAARTFLVAGRLKDVRTYLNKASDRLKDETDKDYLDYRLLEGDYSAEIGDFEAAEQNYQFVIDSTGGEDTEKSEIRARAFHQLGLGKARQGRKEAALLNFNRAADIWDELKEPKRASEARWQAMLLANNLPATTLVRLNRASVTVRVLALQMHERKMATLTPGNSRRSDPDRRYWDQLIQEAGEQDAKQDIVSLQPISVVFAGRGGS